MSRSPPKPSSSSLCIFFKISIFLSFPVQLSRPVINFGLHVYMALLPFNRIQIFTTKNCKVFHQQQLTRSIMMTVITRGIGGRECQGRLQGLEAGGASSCSSAMPAWQQSTSLFRHMLLQQVPPWRSH